MLRKYACRLKPCDPSNKNKSELADHYQGMILFSFALGFYFTAMTKSGIYLDHGQIYLSGTDL